MSHDIPLCRWLIHLTYLKPAAADTIYIVVDTNVLLDHIRILKNFVEDIIFAKVPIKVICPGIVLHELDQCASLVVGSMPDASND
jgi:hypothetical protein